MFFQKEPLSNFAGFLRVVSSFEFIFSPKIAKSRHKPFLRQKATQLLNCSPNEYLTCSKNQQARVPKVLQPYQDPMIYMSTTKESRPRVSYEAVTFRKSVLHLHSRQHKLPSCPKHTILLTVLKLG